MNEVFNVLEILCKLYLVEVHTYIYSFDAWLSNINTKESQIKIIYLLCIKA